MRWIIILLLIINGGYFAWQYYYIPAAGQKSEEELAKESEYDTLVLLSDLSDERKELLGIVNGKNKPSENTNSEKTNSQISPPKDVVKELEKTVGGADKTPSGKVDTKEPVLDKNTKYCYVIGPIKKKKSINSLSRRIKSMGLSIIKVRKTVKKVPSHWIYLGGYKSESDAKNDITRLASKGMKDTQMIKRSATNIVISVGLFSTKTGADERLKKLQDSGFAPQTSMVTANKSQYWIDLKYKDGQIVEESILASFTKGMKDVKVEKGSCQ